MNVTVCDFCKKQFIGTDNEYRIHRKLFQKRYIDWSGEYPNRRWIKVDVCEKCLSDFMDKVKARKQHDSEQT